MSTPVNLNRFRKAKARAEKDAKAEENRVKFGRTKAEKQLQISAEEKARRHLDGHKLETDE
ncbi:MAG: DUF4169 family protein [Anderseniella sp.]|jgi:ribosomal protein L15E|nr:DUF4169 family protein [Anderseniella sp.]